MKGKLSVDFKLAVGSTPTTLIVANLIHHSIGNVEQESVNQHNVLIICLYSWIRSAENLDSQCGERKCD